MQKWQIKTLKKICIQESWIHDDPKSPLVELEGYQCFSIKATTSSHGGLITYVDDKYDVQVNKTVDDSNIWEGLFLELKHSSFQNKIIIGYVHKPPRNNNRARNINAFKSVIEPIIPDELYDHYPYFLGIDYLNIKQTKPPRRVKQKVNNVRAMENLRDDMLDSNITNKLNCDLLADPNENYNILHRHMKSLKHKHMPEKT